MYPQNRCDTCRRCPCCTPGPSYPCCPPSNGLTISIGTVTTGQPGTPAMVSNSGMGCHAVLNFVLPQGEAGSSGTSTYAETITIRHTVTGEPGDSAAVIDVTGSPNHTLDFIIPQGAAGPAGPAGEPGRGTIINCFAASPISLSSSGEYREGAPVFIGPGGFFTPCDFSEDAVTLPAGSVYWAFPMPRDGILSSVSASFSSLTALPCNRDVQIIVRLYSAEVNSEVYTPIMGSEVIFSAESSSGSGISDFSIPIAAQRKLLLAFSLISPCEVTFTGYASAGISIQ